MTRDEVTGLSAANGVVAENIIGLRAHRASGIRVNHRDPQSVLDCGAEDAGFEDSVVTIFIGGDSVSKSTSMDLGRTG